MPSLLPNGGGAKQEHEDQDEGEEMYVEGLARAVDLFSDKTFPTAEECVAHCR